MGRTGKQLNPWNVIINDANRKELTSVDGLKAIVDEDFQEDYNRVVNASRVKQHYLAMSFNQINNPEFNDEEKYPLALMSKYGRARFYTPQINNISFMAPNYPLLYKWDTVPRVSCYLIGLIRLSH
jgi:hypothetical protein